MSDEQLIDPDDDDVSAALDALGGGEAEAPMAEAEAAPADTGYDDVFAEDPEPVEASGPPRGPDGKFVPATPEAPADAGALSSEAVPVVAPQDPYADWQPFTFKADGVESAIEGIRANDTHVVIPRAVWDAEFRPKHLANREAWQQERAQSREQVARAEQYARQVEAQRTEREQRAEAITAQFNALMADPEKLAAFFQDFERSAPILQAQIEAQTYRAQLEQRTQAEQQQRQQTEYQQVFEQSANTFEADITALLKDPKYAALATTEDERTDLLAELWNPALIQLTDEHGRRLPTPMVHRAPILEQLDRRAAFLARRQSTWQKAASAEATNSAAVAPPVTTPRTVPLTKPVPKAAPPVRRPSAPASSARITDDDRAAWRTDFASAFDD